ncbi:MAG: family 16 glycoside hydrolase [Planctomycetota bacterium]|jgi:hypothetical protein
MYRKMAVTFVIVCVSGLFGVSCLQAQVSARFEFSDATIVEIKGLGSELTFSDLPAAVQATARSEIRGLTKINTRDIEVSQYSEGGHTIYQVELTASNIKYELQIVEDGALHKKEMQWEFEEGKSGSVPQGWSIAETNGKGRPAEWQIIKDENVPSGDQAVAITANKNSGKTFNLLFAEEVSRKDITVQVKLKPISGKEDQGGGIVWRVQDPDNYYIARWNPLEENVRVYVVKDGKREQLASAEIKADTNRWQEMDIEAEDEEIQVQFNEEDIIEIEDTTLPGAGMVGLWTKADASTAFDDFGIEIEIDDDLDWAYPAQDFPVADIDLSSARILIMNPDSRILTNAGDMLRDEIEQRTRIGLEVVTSGLRQGAEKIVIGVGDQVTKKYPLPAGLEMPDKADGFALWIDKNTPGATTICLAGVDERGALFAAGRLLRSLKMSRDKVGIDDGVKIATAPKCSPRGHQLGYRPKTNSYDGWTVEMWEQYYRDMIAFGMNAVELIPPKSDDAPDSPHFPKPKLEMMVEMSRLAASYGLDVWIWYPTRDGDYSKPANVKKGLERAKRVFSSLPRVDAVFVPGGDPGSTPPEILMPFLEKLKVVLNRHHPRAQMWVSPQEFDEKGDDYEGQWMKTFLDTLQNDRPDWLDGVVFGPGFITTTLPMLREAVPDRYPIRRYPDITHTMKCQYKLAGWDEAYRNTLGRETINPRPRGYAKIFRDLQRYSIGFISYSEGCNDDFNKVLWSCLGWDPDMKVEDIAKEYSRYFISGRFEDTFARGLFALEENWQGPLIDNVGVYETLKLFQQMEKRALPGELLNWRFQQGLYRAYYDAYIKARLDFETSLEMQAKEVLKKADRIGSSKALDEAEAILDKAEDAMVMPHWKVRVFELAGMLFQSVRMQLSVEKYQGIAVRRGANLDDIDSSLREEENLKDDIDRIRKLKSEQKRLEAIADVL